MEQDLNVYYDISSSKWWFFDQDSGAWIEQEEGQVEELIEHEREDEQTEKREYDNEWRQVDNDANERVGGDHAEPKPNDFNYKNQEEGNQNQSNTYDTQSESDFSYEKIIKTRRTLRKLANEAEIDYSEFQKKNEDRGSDPNPNDPNYTTSTSGAQYSNKNKMYQAVLDNGQSGGREWGGAEEAGQKPAEIEVEQQVEVNIEADAETEAQVQPNDSIYYETVDGVGENSAANYYGTEYDPNAYYSNADIYNGENADKYYALYYGTTTNNEYNTGYAEGYTQGYKEMYDAEYANNYYNGEEYNVQEGVEEATYMEGYEAKYNEMCDTTENQNYIKESDTYYTVPSVKEENTLSEYNQNNGITDGNTIKEGTVPERDTGQVQMEMEMEKEEATEETTEETTEEKKEKEKESNASSHKEQENIKHSEVKNEGNETNSSSNVTGSSNNVDDKINSLLNSSTKSHLQSLSSARLLDKLISRSRSFSKMGKNSKENNSENDLSDAEKMKSAQSKDTLTDEDTEENENTEKKKKYKGQVHFSLSSTNERESKSSIEENCPPEEQGTDEKNKDDVDMDAISVPFVRRATRKLTFKDQGGLSGCIKVFLQKKNELIAEAVTKGEEAPSQEIDIKMANLKRRARELAKRYKSRGTSGNDRDKKEDSETVVENKGDRFLKLVLEVQKKNKEMKEANKAL